ncbi:MAG TPA: type II/IV secretion system protein, partial [Thiolapillus brandeum]|nr:type II/IV secretion system protein [Thiolapillus brandeum]
MATNFTEQLMEHRLNLTTLAQDLNANGRLSDTDLSRIVKSSIVKVHPLVFLAEKKLPDAANPGKSLDMDSLLLWLGAVVTQEVYDIDPLKINVSAVAEVMSQAFAERHRILAVEVNKDEVVIASGEPYIHAWESNLEHVLRKPIRRVLADPRTIARHTAEFYTMAVSVRGARGAERTDSAVGVGNLVQMLELGSMKEPDANDQHIVN